MLANEPHLAPRGSLHSNPKVCRTLVNHNNHWVPMWLKAAYSGRPWLLAAEFDTYEDMFEPVAEGAAAYVDPTGRAAGDCGSHSLLVLKKLSEEHQRPSERRSPGSSSGVLRCFFCTHWGSFPLRSGADVGR